jgi:hypothetical protein
MPLLPEIKDGAGSTVGNLRSEQAEGHISDETVVALVGLGEILRKIDARMRSEGYNISNGKLIKSSKIHGK